MPKIPIQTLRGSLISAIYREDKHQSGIVAMGGFTITCDECGSDANLIMSGLELHAIECSCCGAKFSGFGAHKRGHVYFATPETGGPIKIGFTDGVVTERLRALQTGCHEKLALASACPAYPEAERALHKLFANARTHGEWFERTPEIVAAIKALRVLVGNRNFNIEDDQL